MPAVVPFWSLLKTKCDAEKMASCSGHCCPEIRIFSKLFKKKKKPVVEKPLVICTRSA